MSRSTSTVIVVSVLLGVVLLALALGARGMRTETGLAPPGSVASTPAAATGGAWIAARSEAVGRSFFGLFPGDSTFTVTLQIPVTQDCLDAAGFGGRWPSPDPACASDVDAGGEITGFGYSPSGVPAIVVQLEVPEGCYEAAIPGEAWPPDAASDAECP